MERRPYESMTILNNVEGHDSATPALPLNFKDDFHEGGCLWLKISMMEEEMMFEFLLVFEHS